MLTEIKPIDSITIKKRFTDICKLNSKLNTISKNDTLAASEEYYTQQTILQSKLRDFIRLDFRALNAKELLNLCSLVSKFRPVEPFSFLISCSLLNDKHNSL